MRVAITQRVEWLPERQERRDCLDQRWAGLLSDLECAPFPVANSLPDPAQWATSIGIDAIILTGGNDLATLPDPSDPAPERDATETALLELAKDEGFPVLAVCRGLQMVNVHLGGTLSKCEGHSGSRHPVFWSEETTGGGEEVNSYHNWAVSRDDLASGTEVLAVDHQDHVEAFRHESLPWVAIMWHPEREPELTDRDRTLITGCLRRSPQP